jgi:four helix bundle protein
MSEFLFEKLEIYKISLELGNRIWEMVNRWDKFAKDTLGKQLVRSADSICLNICEGYGRYSYKDKKLFYFYSRGSLYETHVGMTMALKRGLISHQEFNQQIGFIQTLAIKLNAFINSIGRK